MSTTIPNLSRADFLNGASLIDGARVSASTQIEVLNPATLLVLGSISNLGVQAAHAAVEAAQRALPAWRVLSASERGMRLRHWQDLILDHRRDLAALMTAEQGKPLAEAEAEIVYAASFLEWFAEEARRAYGETIPAQQGGQRLLTFKQPIGVVGAITPWNFPAAMITRKVGPALAAGCTVVLKPSELAPFSALALAALALEAGIPPGVFNVLTGEATEIGAVLTSHPAVGKFTFTGSTPVGKRLTAQCATTMKRVSMELGGNAPLLVFDDADLDAAIEGALASKFRNTGQTCVCANRILVQDGVYDRFSEALAARVQDYVVGNGLDQVTHQGPLINAAALAKVERHVDDAMSKGARLVTGGARHAAGELFYAPTVLTEATPDMALSEEETFGPVASLFRFQTEGEALQLANATRFGLAAYAFTQDIDRFWRLAEGLEVGMVGFNTGLISSAVAPFGGIKESGFGREGARQGLDEYLNLKMICTTVRPT